MGQNQIDVKNCVKMDRTVLLTDHTVCQVTSSVLHKLQMKTDVTILF